MKIKGENRNVYISLRESVQVGISVLSQKMFVWVYILNVGLRVQVFLTCRAVP